MRLDIRVLLLFDRIIKFKIEERGLGILNFVILWVYFVYIYFCDLWMMNNW